MIDLVPTAGLCNRMRTIDAALTLAERLQRPLRIHWMPNKDAQCRFSDLFQPIPGVRVVEGMRRASRLAVRFGKRHELMERVGKLTSTTYYNWDENQRLEHDAAALTPIARRRHTHIISYWRFLDRPDKFTAFKPLPALQQRIDEATASFDSHTIGVHIRRSDNEKAIATSPTHLFEQAMQQAIDADGATRFYLATDSQETKALMRARFGDRIMTSEDHAERTSVAGMEHALVELYTLARTSRLFGSFFSSYSRTAAEIGRIEEVTIKL